MSRLSETVRRGALIGYLMAGDPTPARCVDGFRALARGGCDVIEIGVPFSDPVADGPTIQKAGVRALAAGTRMADALSVAAALRAESDVPIVLMTYYNPVQRRGLDAWAKAARESGADGVILPDVPLEESGPAQAAFARAGLDLVQLASPATPPDRLDALARATRGFLYLVSTFGVTGARGELPPEALALAERAKARVGASTPLAVGFGVSRPAHVKALRAAGADGVIVGSALVSMVERGAAPAEIEAFVRELKGAL